MNAQDDAVRDAERSALPTGVSDEARRYLAGLVEARAAGRPSYPPQDDVEGWLRHVAEVDEWFRELVVGDAPPTGGEVREIAGVTTYVQRGRGPELDDGPVVLDLHGGALV